MASVVCNRVPSVWTRASEGKQSRPSAIIRPRTLTPRYLVGTSRPRWRRVQIRSRAGNAFLVEIFLFFIFPVRLTFAQNPGKSGLLQWNKKRLRKRRCSSSYGGRAGRFNRARNHALDRYTHQIVAPHEVVLRFVLFMAAGILWGLWMWNRPEATGRREGQPTVKRWARFQRRGKLRKKSSILCSFTRKH